MRRIKIVHIAPVWERTVAYCEVEDDEAEKLTSGDYPELEEAKLESLLLDPNTTVEVHGHIDNMDSELEVTYDTTPDFKKILGAE